MLAAPFIHMHKHHMVGPSRTTQIAYYSIVCGVVCRVAHNKNFQQQQNIKTPRARSRRANCRSLVCMWYTIVCMWCIVCCC